MFRYLLLACASFGLINNAAGAITSWTTPTIATGDTTGSINVAENIAAGAATGTTFVAVSDDTSATIVYSMTSHATFTLSTTGVLSVAAGVTLDAETTTTYTLTVTANDGAASAAVTITVTVTDINDVTPVFAEPNTCLTVVDATASGTSIATRTATDGDAGDPNNVIGVYAITAASNTNTDFTITAGGVVTTAKVLSAATTPSYTLILLAPDTGATPLTGTATLTVCVGTACCSGAAAFGISWMALMMVLSVFLK